MKLIAMPGRSGSLSTYVTMLNVPVFESVFADYYRQIEQLDQDPCNRAQRALDMAHVRQIQKYLMGSVRAFSAPVATGNIQVIRQLDHGMVEIEVDNPYLIDGQKRVMSSILAAKDNPDVAMDSYPVLFIHTSEIKVMQQLFSDMNSTPAKVSPSLNLVYNHRSSLSSLIPRIVPADLLEIEKGTVSTKSDKLVTTTIMRDVLSILFDTKSADLDKIDGNRLHDCWAEWKPYVDALFLAYQSLAFRFAGFPVLRPVSILPHSVAFMALVRLLPLAKEQGLPPSFVDGIIDLHIQGQTDRSNAIWDGRCIAFGSLKKSSINIDRTAAMLGTLLGVKLTGALKMHAPEQATTEWKGISLMPPLDQPGDDVNNIDFSDIEPYPDADIS